MRFLMTILFHILYTFRGLIQWCLKLFIGLSIFGAIMWGLFYGLHKMGWIMAGVAVVLSIFSWSYDALLLKLQPPGTTLTLYN